MSAEPTAGGNGVRDELCSAKQTIRMPRKIANFLRDWLTPICLLWLIIGQGWEKVFADRLQDREIKFLKELTVPFPALTNRVNVHVQELEELKKTYFRVARDLEIITRNQDRISWTVDAIARKNGIQPPEQIEK